MAGGRPGGRLLRQSALTSIAALVSVVAGLLLSVAIATTFGAGHGTDAFFVGSRIPLGLVALIVAAGNQTLVPAFSTWFVKRDGDDASRAASRVFVAAVLAALAVAAIGFGLSGALVHVTAPGLSASTLSRAATISRIMFFVVPLTTAAEVLRGLLNARYAFVAPAAMNALMSLVAATMVLALGGHGVILVAWAYLAGAGGQLVFMVVLARRHGFRPRPGLRLRDPDVIGVARLSGRPLLAAGLNPAARIGEQVITSFLPTGSISILGYGMTLVNAIGGTVFFRSVIVALLPRLTAAEADNQSERAAELTGLGLRMMFALALPLTVFMVLLAKPGIRGIFASGHFSAHGARLLGLLLVVYSASLMGSALQRGLLAPFFARLDTRTPLRNTVYGVGANLVLLPVCVLPWGRHNPDAILGVAIAYSVSQYVNVTHAAIRLRRTVARPFGARLTWTWRPVVASLGAGVAIFCVSALAHLDHPSDRLVLLSKTLGAALVGLAVLGGLLAVLCRGELVAMARRARDQRGGGGHFQRRPAATTTPASPASSRDTTTASSAES